MKNQMMNKLRSNQGASVVLALLLFLVCAVVGSIVLTAATVSAGRMSKLVEMDQRYYSVTSAAELLRSQFDNEKVSLVFQKTEVDDGAGGKKKTLVFSSGSYIDSENHKIEIAETNKGFLYYQALSVLNDSGDTDWVTYNLGNQELPPTGKEFSLEASNDSSAIDILKAKVTVSKITAPQRGLRFTVQNDNGDSNLYQLPLTCTADILKEVAGDKITYTVTWTVSDLGK